MIARVSGILRVTVEPRPGSLVSDKEPRKVSRLRWTTSMPTPRPEISVTRVAVEKPGWNMSASTSWILMLLGQG